MSKRIVELLQGPAPIQEALKGDILKGDIWKWDFALQLALENGIWLCLQFALDTSILTALSKEIPQGRHSLDRQGAV